MLDSFRQRAMVRFLSIYPRAGVEGLLKQASERFEKSKRMRYIVGSSNLDKQKDQKATEGLLLTFNSMKEETTVPVVANMAQHSQILPRSKCFSWSLNWKFFKLFFSLHASTTLSDCTTFECR